MQYLLSKSLSFLFENYQLIAYTTLAISFAVIAVLIIIDYLQYKKSSYFEITKTPYIVLRGDMGQLGEYLTYKALKSFEKDGAKFLFNIYLPKENNDTTEIDVLMICKKGLFVFESKNYSGWIFGNDTSKNWYQTLPNKKGGSRKEAFYNPIFQNRSHIESLKSFVNPDIPMYSVIVFSNRCTLKNIDLVHTDAYVVKRESVYTTVIKEYKNTSTDSLDKSEITNIYNALYIYTQTDEATKSAHISNIQNNLKHVNIQIRNYSNSETMKCPRCGGILVERISKRGENIGEKFYGCSNYPKCRYTKK